MLFDDEAASLLERAYATTDMVLQREASRQSLRASSGESILDLGSGPGFLACEIAEEVGETGRVNATYAEVDRSPGRGLRGFELVAPSRHAENDPSLCVARFDAVMCRDDRVRVDDRIDDRS